MKYIGSKSSDDLDERWIEHRYDSISPLVAIPRAALVSYQRRVSIVNPEE